MFEATLNLSQLGLVFFSDDQDSDQDVEDDYGDESWP